MELFEAFWKFWIITNIYGIVITTIVGLMGYEDWDWWLIGMLATNGLYLLGFGFIIFFLWIIGL